jgi:spermidine/putrescine transport system substrate-binding protein
MTEKSQISSKTQERMPSTLKRCIESGASCQWRPDKLGIRGCWPICFRAVAVLACLIGFLSGEAAMGQNEKQIVLFCWPGYVPETVTDAFAEETGIQVLKEYFSTNEAMLLHRLTDRRYDLVQPSDYAAEALIQRDALEPLRPNNIPNLRNLDPKFRGLPHDPEDKYTAPWLSGTVGIVVNTERVTEPVGGYGDLFAGKYRGRIVALNDPREWLGFALCHLGLSVNEVTPEVLEKVETVWREWMPQVAVFDSDNAADVMLNGDADMALTWSGDAATLLAASPKYQFVLPSEGAHRYVDCLAIPRGAPHRNEAEQFINFILRPDISLMISKAIPFTNPNREAYERLSRRAKANPASYPQGDPDLRSFRALGEMTEHVEKLYNDLRFRADVD